MSVFVAGSGAQLHSLVAVGSGLSLGDVPCVRDFPTLSFDQSRDVLLQLVKPLTSTALCDVVHLLTGKGMYMTALFDRLAAHEEPTLEDGLDLVSEANFLREDLVCRGFVLLEAAKKQGALHRVQWTELCARVVRACQRVDGARGEGLKWSAFDDKEALKVVDAFLCRVDPQFGPPGVCQEMKIDFCDTICLDALRAMVFKKLRPPSIRYRMYA
jgi:hypothetical protein